MAADPYMGERDLASVKFAVTNYTEDLSLSGTESGAANIAAVLATVINTLIDKGILRGTVS